MNIRLSAFTLALALAAGGAPAQDKEAQAAQLDKFILDMFNAHQGNTLCMLGNVPVHVVRSMIVDQLKASGAAETATQQQVETAIWTRFPCPFSPYRAEVLPATAKNVEGVWLFPHDSQPYRYGPKSPQQPTDRAMAVTCEAVGYFPNGELRTGVVIDAKTACPFRKAADLDPARKRPRVANWSIPSEGRLTVTRTDVKDHIEQWDVYTVTRTFQALNMQIKAGDLIAYMRRDKDNEANAATEFRHLRRLK